jgi:DNA-binding CsgD family transcriptional regulator
MRALSALAEAKAHFQAGRYEEALREAEHASRARGAEARDAAVVAARVELRQGNAGAVVARLEPLHRRRPGEPTVATLLGIANFRLGRDLIGVRMIEDAYRSTTDVEARSEAAYYRGWAAYARRELDVADRWVATSLDDASGAVYARGLALSAWISEAREDYAGAKRSHRLALSALRNAAERDDELAARILHALAVYAAEMPDPRLAEFVRTQTHGFAWPASVVVHHFQTEMHLALARVNEGDVNRAMDEFETAESSAGDIASLNAQARLEIADLYRVLGEPVAARRALNSAAQLLRQVDWKHAETSDEMGLLESACLAARLDPPRASEWIARYAATSKHDPGWPTLTADRRVQAIELQARGIVQAAVGDREKGAERLREAAQLYELLGYRRRAAYAFADLSDAGDLAASARIASLLADVPAHPLLRIANARPAARSRATVAARAYDVAPAERRVLDALCSGMSVKQMAKEWDRSEYTIRNHLKRLFAKFGVASSAALVAKAMSDDQGGVPYAGAPAARSRARIASQRSRK